MYYAAAPSNNTMEYAPQGWLGDIVSGIAPVAGSFIGGLAGNQQLGSNIGNIAGHLGSLLPFEANPTAYAGLQPLAAAPQPLAAGPQAYAPQGWIGDIVSGIAPVAGGVIGGAMGNKQMGTNIGNLASEVAKWLPFQAAPTAYQGLQPLAVAPQAFAPQAYAPQGLIGGLLGGPLGGALGGALGGLFGNRSLGEQIGSGIGGIGGGLLPFSAAPNPYLGQVG